MTNFLRYFVFLFLINLFFVSKIYAENETDRSDEIKAAIANYLLQKNAGADFDARIKRISMPKVSVAADLTLDYEIIPPANWEGWSSVNIALVVRNGNRVLKNIPVRVEVDAKTDMVATKKHVSRGTIISAADLVVKKMDVAPTKGDYLKSIEDVVGRRAKQNLRPNIAVISEHIEKVAIIKSGQIVTVILESAAMKISMAAKAKSSGGVGDTIIIQNMSSLKEFPAKIKDANTVIAPF